MTAETAYHVIKALPKKEVPRLFKMLGVNVPKVEKSKRTPLVTDAMATEQLLKYLKPKI